MPVSIDPTVRSRADVERMVSESSKKLHGFKRKQRPNLPKVPSIYIFNVSDKTFKWHLPGFDFFEIKPCAEGQDYSEPCVVPGICTEEVLEGDSTQLNQYDGMDIANDIIGVGPGLRRESDIRPFGVFISLTNPPSMEDVQEAQKALARTWQLLVQEGDRIYTQGESKGAQGQLISEDMRWAARCSKQQCDWARVSKRMIDCPGCGQPVAEGVAVHLPWNVCGAVIDLDKAIKMFPGREELRQMKKEQEKPKGRTAA